MPRTARRTAPLLPPRCVMPNSYEYDHSFNHRAQHVTNRCARTPTNHGQIVRQSRNSPNPKQQSAEFANSPCLKNRLTKRLIARLSFLTTRARKIHRHSALRSKMRSVVVRSANCRLWPNVSAKSFGELRGASNAASSVTHSAHPGLHSAGSF